MTLCCKKVRSEILNFIRLEALTLSIKQLAKSGRLVKLTTGEIIYHDGDQTYEMFIVLTGGVEIYIEQGGKSMVITRLKQGDFFGEMAVLEEMPHSGNARAVDDTILVAINRTNFEKAIHNDSELSWKIMKGLSARIRSLNRELAQLSQARMSSGLEEAETDNAIRIGIDDDNDIGVEGAGLPGEENEEMPGSEEPGETTTPHLEATCPSQPSGMIVDDDFYSSKLFSKEITCPVCQELFRAKMVRSSKLMRVGTDNDFRSRYQDFEPLWYAVWVCPVCYYANYRNDFLKLPDISRRVLKNYKDKRRDNYSPGFGSQRTIRDIIEGYRLVVECAEAVKERDEKLGNLWLNLSWLYEDIGDEDRLNEALDKARQYLESSYLGSSNLSPERLQKLGYLTGEMYRKLGHYVKARDFFYRSLNRRSGNAAINTMVEDQLQSVKEILSQLEASQE